MGPRALKSLQRHMPPSTLAGSIAKHVHFRRIAPATAGGQEKGLLPVYGKDVRASGPEARDGNDYDQLAILGPLDPASPSLDGRYGLEGLCPEETLGALALDGPSTASTRWITQLSPREGLASIGLIHDSDIR
jgi:hypothetical protein